MMRRADSNSLLDLQLIIKNISFEVTSPELQSPQTYNPSLAKLWPNNEEGLVSQCSNTLQLGKWESIYESLP